MPSLCPSIQQLEHSSPHTHGTPTAPQRAPARFGGRDRPKGGRRAICTVELAVGEERKRVESPGATGEWPSWLFRVYEARGGRLKSFKFFERTSKSVQRRLTYPADWG